ncbi:MAG: cell division protein FtsA, partial [Lachnospiraceae bacterium]|nr:cell division protein FtsA [Lachnospiraceae bacterium]
MAEAMKFPGQLVFGLDIGTRSIVGTVGYRTGGKFHVVTQSIREHQTRAMLDGQIHDIYKVGGTIKEVKAELEERIGRTLKDVCIAAAGRVLQTVTLRVDQDLEGEREVSGEDIYALDSLGVERAYAEFLENNSMDMKFYCVGYSVVRYYMNGYTMGNLERHKAKTIGEDLIATFLPEDVVDGLY